MNNRCRWKIYGLALPDQVLEKIYRNADRLFAQTKGAVQKAGGEQ